MGRWVQVYLVMGAGCGGCALEAQAALAKRYRAARRGIRAVETPAHADVLVICGALEGALGEAARSLGMDPSEVWGWVRVGDCAPAGPWAEGGVAVAGCPPSPEAILEGILEAWGRRRRPAAAGRGNGEKPEAER